MSVLAVENFRHVQRGVSGAANMCESFRSNPTQPCRGSRIVFALVQQATVLLMLASASLAFADTSDQASRFIFERDNRTIVLEPFGPNIVHITLSSQKPAQLAAP